MQIIVAENAGFCFGVTRAVDITIKQREGGNPGRTYTLGPLIHNNDVVDSLRKEGIYPLSFDEIDKLVEDDTIVIRSHGVTPETIDEIRNTGAKIIDATCPYVTSIQRKARKYHDKGYQIIIVGNKDHPEVIGINGWCYNSAVITRDGSDLDKLPQRVCIVSQTTERLSNYEKALKVVSEKCEDVLSFNTICSATKERQASAYEVSKDVGLMIVIGGRNSSNSKKLYEICSKNCGNTIFIENSSELSAEAVKKMLSEGVEKVGVTAGASTPDWVINEVMEKLEELGREIDND
ncbi:MAG TPA: 4-hydroxy-3-methylbut-2-enyl diphosphate reductase [Clostridia bacterium]|nr:4-hydroxy-3-methylbut-2-enyl diphosphate reductase [Clostridia bacterium]